MGVGQGFINEGQVKGLSVRVDQGFISGGQVKGLSGGGSMVLSVRGVNGFISEWGQWFY